MQLFTSSSGAGHTSVQRKEKNRFRLIAAWIGAPVFWVLQMSLSQIIASYACYPHRVPLDSPLWNNVSWMLGAVSLGCFSGALCCGALAWSDWRARRNETSDTAHKTIEVGEERSRFLALLSLFSSLLFLIAIIFTGNALFLVSLCGA